MLNPRWIINATSSTVMDFDLDQEFSQTKKLILTVSDKIQSRKKMQDNK